ncbi:MAG: Dehydrogenase, Zn-dependent [Rariglobus sp.]|jgi:threonine dehydrogenase-like Zn-dependent dehydrogenase|nr:Dehydrogenase, Zn-dependent [Rariglobus sp.]
MRQILFTARETASLSEVPDAFDPIKAGDVRGRTLVSLVSPGTELNWGYLGDTFPAATGYACVFEIDETGSAVRDLAPGSLVFASGPHAGRQQADRSQVTPIPAGLAPETAVFARLMGVSMSTLNTAAARAPARVLVTGLGPVGNLAAQVFTRCGYRVTALDPVDSRRASARAAGLTDVRASFADCKDLAGHVALHLECSGHEQAVLDGCKIVAKRGEVVLIGVPWRKRTEISSFELLHAVFHNYAVIRSGWEWEVPGQPRDFSFHSLSANYAAALSWLQEGSVKVDGLATTFSPADAQAVYAGLLAQSLPSPGALFDWR